MDPLAAKRFPKNALSSLEKSWKMKKAKNKEYHFKIKEDLPQNPPKYMEKDKDSSGSIFVTSFFLSKVCRCMC